MASSTAKRKETKRHFQLWIKPSVLREAENLRNESLIETTQRYRTSGGCSSLRFKLTDQK